MSVHIVCVNVLDCVWAYAHDHIHIYMGLGGGAEALE